jgi:hypothetical protein
MSVACGHGAANLPILANDSSVAKRDHRCNLPLRMESLWLDAMLSRITADTPTGATGQ